MAYVGGPDYERAARATGYVAFGAMLILAVYTALRPGTPPPANSKAYGCYTNPATAAIRLDREGMAIFQSDPIRIGYHLERGKTGIMLTAEAPISADLVGKRYLYSIGSRGIGLFLPFFNEQNGRSYGEFDEDRLQQFTMLANNGVELAYRKADPGACDQRAS
ncbi:hypothetical protein ACCC88_07380 [Sphingomonas sp. Sphisp140]|uniref:hypothetical protein n=1 Tax=unclassified Sphingomonas TaxID=196159 RepID=UPI0039AF557A